MIDHLYINNLYFHILHTILENYNKNKAQFGNRIVCTRGNAKHRKEFKQNMEKRMNAIYEWQAKKYEQLQTLRAQRDHSKVNCFEFHKID